MIYANVDKNRRQQLQTELALAEDSGWYRRLKIIDLSSQRYSVPNLASMFDLCKATVRSYIHSFNEGGFENLKRQYSPGAPVKVPLTRDEIEEVLHQSPHQFEKLDTGARNWDQELLSLYFQEYHQVQIGQSAISKMLTRLDIRLNRGKLKVTSPDPEYKSKRQRIETFKKKRMTVT